MCAMIGMDAPAVQALGKIFTNSAAHLDSAERDISVRLRGTPWDGPASDRFRSQWYSYHVKALVNAAQLLREVAAALEREAREQEEASGSGASAGGTDGRPHSGGDSTWDIVRGAGLKALGWLKTGVQLPFELIDDAAWARKYLPTVLKIAGSEPVAVLNTVLDTVDLYRTMTDMQQEWENGEWAHFAGDLSHLTGFELKAMAKELGVRGGEVTALLYLSGIFFEGTSQILSEDTLKDFQWPSWSQLHDNGPEAALDTLSDLIRWAQ